MAIVVPIVTEYVDKGLKSALTDIRKADGAFGKMNAAWSAVGPAAAAAGLAVGAFAIKLGVDAVQAAIAEEGEIAKLNTALKNIGFAQATSDVEAWIAAQAAATTFSDDSLRPAMVNLATATGSVTAAQALLKLAMDASIGSGKSLDGVTTALEKAYNGNTTSLGKMFPALDKNKLATEGMDYATRELAALYAGQASAAAGTWQGKIGNLTEAFGELQESFGAGFLKGLEDATGDKGSGMTGLTDAMLKAQEAANAFGEAIGSTFGDLIILLGHITDLKDTFEDLRASLQDTPWGKIIDTIALAFERLLNPLKAIVIAIDGIKAGIASLQNLSIPSIPGLNAAAASTGPSTYGSAPSITVNVTGAVDPVGVSRQIERILATGRMRGGRGV
jgi:phage-related protein